MAENENLDLLDLEDDAELMDLPTADPFAAAPRPKKPWLLLGIAVVVIVLATYIIIRVIGHSPSDSVDINLDRPTVVTVDGQDVPPPPSDFEAGADRLVVGSAGQDGSSVGHPVVEKNNQTGAPVRIVEDRADVKFNPDAPTVAAPKPRPAAKPATTTVAKPAVKKPATSKVTASGGFAVQVASYSTRSAAEAGQKKIRAEHPSLLADHQFVILAAQLPDGKTVYRLRVVGFKTSADANSFCHNAKSDGLDCYVTK